MKALLLTAPSAFEFTDVPTPTPGPGEVRIDVRVCGICGSAIHGMDGRSGRRIPPIVMGHEAAGVICALRTDAGDWQIGDRVTFDSTEFCGECEECQRGNFNLCANRKVLGVSCGDYRRHGCFAEQVVLPVRIQTGDLDGPLLFLASEESRYMTGQLLLIDGGISTGATRAVPRKEQP